MPTNLRLLKNLQKPVRGVALETSAIRYHGSMFWLRWYPAAAACGSLLVALIVFGPALHGQFVFDDLSLPIRGPLQQAPLRTWLSGVRPVLMLSYWLNRQLLGDAPFGYHFVNFIIHCANSVLVYLVISRIFRLAGWVHSQRTRWAIGGSVVFLLHPIQTESVSYIAGRSESLASLFVLVGYLWFLERAERGLSWTASVIVVIFLAIGVGTKENAVSLAGLIILTDAFWPKPFAAEGLRRSWRLYVLLTPLAIGLVAGVFQMLATAPTAGFSVATSRWYQYAFTEMRAIPAYVRLAILPFGQSLDHDFPISHTAMEHGALFYGFLGLAAVVGLIRRRRHYPLACFGILVFLVLLAPTSSVVPIDDPLVERRIYLPLVGLILAACDLCSRISLQRTKWVYILAGVAIFFGGVSFARNQMWGEPDKLLMQAAQEASTNPRPMLNLTEILIRNNRCDLAIPYLQRATRILGENYFVEVGWGRTLACLNRDTEALERLTLAARLQPTAQVFEWLGLLYGKMGRFAEAGESLQKAVSLEPDRESAHGSLALWYESTHDLSGAQREYQKAISLDPSDLWAKASLTRVQDLQRARP